MVSELPGQSDRAETVARLAEKALDKKNNDISWATATALAFLDEGRRLLLEVSNDNRKGDSSVGIAPRPSEFFAGLTDPSRKKAFEGLGLTVIGSTVYALEEAVHSEWDDNNYFSRFQETTKGTPLAYLPTDQINPLRGQSYIKNEKGMIEQILKEEKSGIYAPFFESYYSLPRIIKVHLEMFGQGREARLCISYAIELYKEIARRVSSETPPAEIAPNPGSPPEPFTKERQKGFLGGIDAIINRTPIENQVEGIINDAFNSSSK